MNLSKLLFVVALSLGSTASPADEVSHSVTWGSGNRCSAMCNAYRSQADGYCKVHGYAGGSAKSCNCNEGGSAPNAFGKLECTGKLPKDEIAIVGTIALETNEKCSAASGRFDARATSYCNLKGYRTGERAGPVQCDELGGHKAWGIMHCKHPNPPEVDMDKIK